MYLICGEALYDVFVDLDGTEADREVSFIAKPGGSPHNVAIGLARLGCAAALATEIANDNLGRRLERRLRDEGVDCRFLRRTGIATPLAMVEIDGGGTASYTFHGLDRTMYHPDLSNVKQHWESLFGLHVGSISIISRQSAGQLFELVAAAPDRVLVSFDPNIRLSIEPDVVRWQDAVETFRRRAHLIKVSEDDLLHLYGTGTNVDTIAQQWLEHRCSLVVVTRGARGATLFSREHGRVEVQPIPVVVADTVGAGDSFQAAVLAWLAEREYVAPAELARLSADQLAQLGRFAALAAASTCSHRGPEFPFLNALKSNISSVPTLIE